MICYALPTPNGRVLWTPGPRFPWGELEGLGDTITVLSGDVTWVEDMEDKIPAMLHDNLFRPVIRKTFTRRFINTWLPRAMLWGVIWLVGRSGGESVLEGVVSGLYLLIGLPLFFRLTNDVFLSHISGVLSRFKALFYSPHVEIVFCARLRRLEGFMHAGGPLVMLERLDELGLGHLREFYRRVAWSGRWEVGPPTGQGIL